MRFAWFVAVVVVALGLDLGSRGDAQAATGRFAFVLGNAHYAELGTLPNPTNDARLIGSALTGLGFEVEMQTDLTRDQLNAVLPRVAERARNADLVLLFYAGHGLAIDGQNFIVPVDARLPSEQAEVAGQMVPLGRVMEALEGSAKATLIFLDSCRNNPYNDDDAGAAVRRGRLKITRGLAEMSVGASNSPGRGLARMDAGGAGMFVAFATKPGEFAYDAEAEGAENSPFTAALFHQIGAPGVSLEAVMIRVRREVQDATARKQLPWTQSSLVDEEVFLGGKPQLTPASLAEQQRFADAQAAQRRAAAARPPPSTGALPVTRDEVTAHTPSESNPSGAGATQLAMSLPSLQTLGGKWRGHGGGWTVDARLDGNRVEGRAECSNGTTYRFSGEVDESRTIDLWATKITPAPLMPPSMKVKGIFPSIGLFSAAYSVGSSGVSGCATETLSLEPAVEG